MYKNKYLKYKRKYLEKKNLIQNGGESGQCSFCNISIENLLRCSKCRYIGYCSKNCQKTDWEKHKCICSNNPGETEIRYKAANAIKKFYQTINIKFDYSADTSKNYMYKYNYPGWYRAPLPHDIIGIRNLRMESNYYDNIRLYPVPLFNYPLNEILNFNTIETDRDPTPIMDCTNAFGMTMFAILNAVIPEYINKLLNISIIDQLINSNSKIKSNMLGYNRNIETNIIKSYINSKELLEEDYNELNNILLNENKSKRLYIIYYIKNLFFVHNKSDKIKLGDGCYIYGHSLYETTMGSYVGENVYCVDFTSDGKPLFMGFSGNQKNVQDNFDFTNPQELGTIQRFLAIEYLKAVNTELTEKNIQIALKDVSSRNVVIQAGLMIDSFKKVPLDISKLSIRDITLEEIENQQSDITNENLLRLLNVSL